MFAVLFVQLIKLTIVQGAAFAAASVKLDKGVITVPGARGSILDRNGLPLAYDQKSFNVQFYKDPKKTSAEDRAYYTDIITKTIGIIERNGGKTIDTFAIKYNGDTGEYYFDWGDIKEEQQKAREKNWRSNMFVGDTRTPEQIYLYLRDKYRIPCETDYEEARKILSVWQEVQLASWTAYNPVVIAYGVNIQTVAEIMTHGNELTGMGVAESTTRIYPRGQLAANVLGYMSRIPSSLSADQLKALKNKGYTNDSLIGAEGIEKSMEDYLTGNSTSRLGMKVVEVDKYKVVRNVLSSTQPKQGNNAILTIDVPLQQAVEQSLAKNIPYIRQKEIEYFEANKDSRAYRDLDVNKLKLATSGAAVVLDVDTGEVLAMGNYPSFDPNLFIGGIPDKEYQALKKDPGAPLFNKAISSRDTPGSIFKMVTGLAGLMEGEKNPEKGITLNTRISDEGEYTAILRPGASQGPHCWVYPYVSPHKNQDIVDGLAHSCDYFFYEVSRRLGIDLLDKWGRTFGLTSSTGIELPGESIGFIGNQKILYDPSKPIDKQATYLPSLVKNQKTYGLLQMLKKFAAQRKVNYSEEVYSKTADDLIALAGITWTPDPNERNILKDDKGRTMGDVVRLILNKDMQIRTQTSKAYGWGEQISQYISSNLIWTPYLTITTGIGQGVVQVTPIALARYVAALANGGTVYETHIVKKITDQSGQTVFEQKPVVFSTLDAPKEYLDALKKGMASVVSAEDGTARDYFKNFEYTDKIAGKTGTAQVSDVDLEDNSWFVCLAPYDQNDESVKPEIAIVVYIPHGFKGGWATYVVKDIVQFYMDRKKTIAQQNIPAVDSLVN